MTTKNSNLKISTNKVNEACKKIAEFIRSNDLTIENINEICGAIETNDCVLGLKLLTNENIKIALDDNFGGIGEILNEHAQCEIANNIELATDALNECNDAEWEVIIASIRNSDVFVRVKGINWNISEKDFDSKEEYEEHLSELPKIVEIPIKEFKYCDDYTNRVTDYLSDEYEDCHEGWDSIELIVKN